MLVIQRIQEMRDAETLQDLMTLPAPRCHPMTADRKGEFSVDLEGPYRLLFVPANDPLPKLADGGIDLSRITAVRVLERKDTHG